jgi:hypothetical protein
MSKGYGLEHPQEHDQEDGADQYPDPPWSSHGRKLPELPRGKPGRLDPGGAQACKMPRLSSREGLQLCDSHPPGCPPRLATRMA